MFAKLGLQTWTVVGAKEHYQYSSAFVEAVNKQIKEQQQGLSHLFRIKSIEVTWFMRKSWKRELVKLEDVLIALDLAKFQRISPS
jgi:hypothetical protein